MTTLKPGDRMPDGTIFAGISPDTGEAIYAMASDAPLTMKWKAAMEYAAKLDAHGHQDWRVPPQEEVNTLYNKHAPPRGSYIFCFPAARLGLSSSRNYHLHAAGARLRRG